MYGLWPGVAAIVAEHEVLCVECSMTRYGEQVIQDVIAGRGHHEDSDGNELHVILNGDPDLQELVHCMACGESLGDD